MTTRSKGRATRTAKPGKFPRTRPASHTIPNAKNPDEEYRVGPGRPPKEFQFKPGQSGNPKGAKRKNPIVPDLKATLERALNGTVALNLGEKERIVSKVEAGITHLVDAFAAGDRHARRDLIDLAQRLDVDLLGSQRRQWLLSLLWRSQTRARSACSLPVRHARKVQSAKCRDASWANRTAAISARDAWASRFYR